ncbi:hypothetical protein GCM10017752_41860 [Streptomyces roseoviridis]
MANSQVKSSGAGGVLMHRPYKAPAGPEAAPHRPGGAPGGARPGRGGGGGRGGGTGEAGEAGGRAGAGAEAGRGGRGRDGGAEAGAGRGRGGGRARPWRGRAGRDGGAPRMLTGARELVAAFELAPHPAGLPRPGARHRTEGPRPGPDRLLRRRGVLTNYRRPDVR